MPPDLDPHLRAYADQLLTGTGLTTDTALTLLTDPPTDPAATHPDPITEALLDGWNTATETP